MELIKIYVLSSQAFPIKQIVDDKLPIGISFLNLTKFTL